MGESYLPVTNRLRTDSIACSDSHRDSDSVNLKRREPGHTIG